ncbi:MAG: sulfate permease [Bacteroidota bacterium]|jgi:SulP family sulfate permease
MNKRLEPKLFSILRKGYSLKDFTSDLTAGVIVGIVALPLAIAFAIASGVKPEQGLYTAIIAGFFIAIFGGSRAQVSGPTGAFIVIIYGIVHQYGYSGLMIATFLAGVMLVVMGIARAGVFLKFIPYPVVVGFTSGIALIIFSSQMRDFFGLQMDDVPAEFIDKWMAYGESIATVHLPSLLVGLGSLIIIILWPRVTKRIPGSLIALLIATTVVAIFRLPVETIGSQFGGMPSHFPSPHIPQISWKLATKMFSPAITIALLAALESLLSAVVADGMLGTRHRSNMELIAQGIGNILSPIFGGIPATGAIARTATNIRNGGRTPVSAIIHSLVLLLILLVAGKWAALIPMSVLAAILIYVAYTMSEWHSFVKLLRGPRGDVVVLVSTFLLTVFIDLTVAIQVGVVFAAFLFLQRMSNATQIGLITKDLKDEEKEEEEPTLARRNVPAGVEVFSISGSLFFGAIEQFRDAVQRIEKAPKVLILEMRNVITIDATGLQALEDLLKRLRKGKTALLLVGVHAQPLFAMQRSQFVDTIGEDNLIGSLDEALARAAEIIALKKPVTT